MAIPDGEPEGRKRSRTGWLATAVAGALLALGGACLAALCATAPFVLVAIGLGAILGALDHASVYLLAVGLAITLLAVAWGWRGRSRS